jgi:hypothetical protein
MLLLVLAVLSQIQAQPTPPSQLTVDESFGPAFDAPDFKSGEKPIVLVDDSHRNVITLKTYLGPVGAWLGRLGYSIRPSGVSLDNLSQPGTGPRTILVIANAQAREGAPADASAFTEEEIIGLTGWVHDGGALLLVADRAPFGGPARELAKSFGVTLENNTILTKGPDGAPTGELTIEVSRADRRHPLFDRVLRIVYVVGESLDGPGVVLRAPENTYSGPTAQATEGPSAAGKPLILAFEHGKGRMAVIGDGGVVSAFGSAGGNSHRGISEGDNARFVRNLFKWLAAR